jgi:hypothetical protein
MAEILVAPSQEGITEKSGRGVSNYWKGCRITEKGVELQGGCLCTNPLTIYM